MAKLPENFGYEEKPAHPYRALVITAAVLIGGSLFAGGMFYQSAMESESKPAEDIFGSAVSPKPKAETIPKALSEAEVKKVFAQKEKGVVANNSPSLTREQVGNVAEAKSPAPNKPLTEAQIQALFK